MLDINKIYRFDDETEEPLEALVTDGGFCGILRTLGCVGDSLSSGEFESLDANGYKGYHDLYDYSWGQFIARAAGITAYNFSRGGMTARAFIQDFGKSKGFYDTDKVCRSYILALGVNDISEALRGDTPFGDIEDFDQAEPEKSAHSFVGYYGRIIADIKKMQPKARIFLMTLPDDTWGEEKRIELGEKHREILYKLADMFEFTYVIDLKKYGPKYDANFKKKFYLAGHMNACGYQFTAQMVMSYIDYIIRHNMDDFTQIGFVGTPHHNPEFKW